MKEPMVIFDTSKMFSVYNLLGRRIAVIVADTKSAAREELRGWERYFAITRPYRYRVGDFEA